MARLPRFAPVGIPQHVIQRGNNRQPCFCEDKDFGVYADFLKDAADKYQVDVHAWCFMTNHVHLLVTPQEEGGVSIMMQSLGRRYVQYFNRKYKRTGTLWEGRFKSCLVDTEAYLLTCYRYIELNPVRAKMVTHPKDYQWSSYQINSGNKKSELLTPHDEFLKLGKTEFERFKAYCNLFNKPLSSEKVEQIRTSTHRGLVVGSEKFKNEIEIIIGESVRPQPVGRPWHVKEEPFLYF